MELLLSDPYRYLDAFFLIFMRISSLFILVPFFSNRNIPVISKIALAFFLSTIVINLTDVSLVVSSTNVLEYAMVVIKEIAVGWLIGMGAYMVYSVITLAGEFIDNQIGFSMVNVFDPLSQVSLTISGNFYFYLVLVLTIISNAHHFFIIGIIKSFELIPIGEIALSSSLYDSFVGFINEFFMIALQISAPFFFVMLLTNVVLGILARTAPQLNLFAIGFPLKIFLGLLVMLVTLNVFISVSDILVDKSKTIIDDFIKGMMP